MEFPGKAEFYGNGSGEAQGCVEAREFVGLRIRQGIHEIRTSEFSGEAEGGGGFDWVKRERERHGNEVEARGIGDEVERGQAMELEREGDLSGQGGGRGCRVLGMGREGWGEVWDEDARWRGGESR